jgi:hypothetical protein
MKGCDPLRGGKTVTARAVAVGLVDRIRGLWSRDPKGMSIDLLRVGVGLVWAMNLLFIVMPSNQFFPMFRSMASSYGATSLGGPGFANFVASYPGIFSWAIAFLTAYLAVAFLAGITTRLACAVGAVASVLFLITQFYATFALNGAGTDVGAHPLYLLVYVILFTGGAGQYFAFDHWVWASGRAKFPRLSRWLAAPRELPCNAECPAAGLRPLVAGGAGSATGGPSQGPPGVFGAAPVRLGTLVAVCLVVLAILAVGTAAPREQANSASSAPSMVAVQDIVYQIGYTGNATWGGFGPAFQDGCFGCAADAAPGSSLVEMVMLTDNHSALPLTIYQLSVQAPFTLSSGPAMPHTVAAGRMWMFDVTLGVPATPGAYTVHLVVQTT